MENRYNLIQEPWIPVVGRGYVSLAEIFSDFKLKELAGTPIQKCCVLKLLLAIAQAAYTPIDDEAWMKLGVAGMANACLGYLEDNKDSFWLYGNKPFLQIPQLEKYKVNIKGNPVTYYSKGRSFLPDMSAENDTILFDLQIDQPYTDAEFALLIVSLMNYAPGGKRVENIGALEGSCVEKSPSAKAGPSLGGYVGYLQTFLWSSEILQTLYINMHTQTSIRGLGFWSDHSVVPPWEAMPASEVDENARRIKNSIMGSLCAISRFVLLTEKGLLYTEGLQYPSHKDGWREPFFSWNSRDQFLWLNSDNKPWREIVALLSIPMGSGETSYHCPQIDLFWNRARSAVAELGIWSGGMQVRGTAGDQSVKQKDDFIESIILVNSCIIGDYWFGELKKQIEQFEVFSNSLYNAISKYQKELKMQGDGNRGAAQYSFWELCESLFYQIVNIDNIDSISWQINRRAAEIVMQLFDKYCPNQTSRQILAWAKHRPQLGKFFSR